MKAGTELPRLKNIPFEQLAIVHTTRYRPAINQDGQLTIPTTFDACGGMEQDFAKLKSRQTVHATLNGAVTGHEFGDWSDASFIIISPLSDAIESNGLPDSLSAADTYWAKEIGAPLTLNNYIIIEKKGLPDAKPDDGQTIIVDDPFKHVEAALKLFHCPHEQIGKSGWSGGSSDEEYDLCQALGIERNGYHMGSPHERMETLLAGGYAPDIIRQELDGKLGPDIQKSLETVLTSPQYFEKNQMEDGLRHLKQIESRLGDMPDDWKPAKTPESIVSNYSQFPSKYQTAAAHMGVFNLPSPNAVQHWLERKTGKDLGHAIKPLHHTQSAPPPPPPPCA